MDECNVLQNLKIFALCDDLWGGPRSVADAPAGLLVPSLNLEASGSRGTRADQGVRPTISSLGGYNEI